MVQMVSPLGKYSQVVAAAMAIVCIVGGGGALVFVPDLSEQTHTIIMGAFFTALGAVFGSVATVNGVRTDIVAAHRRLDAAGVPAAPETLEVNDGVSGRGGSGGGAGSPIG